MTETSRKRNNPSTGDSNMSDIEDNIEYPSPDESSTDEESEDETKPKLMKGNEPIFSSGFQFEINEDDPWKQYFHDRRNHKRKFVDLDVKIAQSRREVAEKAKKLKMLQKTEADEEDQIKDEDEDSDVIIDEDDMRTADKLNIKDDAIKRKEKLNESKKKKISKKDEDLNTQFFEDAPFFQSDSTFQEMNLSRQLLKAIDNMCYDTPTPIQAATIPVALLGRDICGCAATGTGKTAAFMLPILERLLFKPKEDLVTRVLVLVPTRELGVQVFEVTKKLARYSLVDIALSVGGLDLRSQEINLRKNPDIVIATPGRLIDHLQNTPSFSLDRIEILVLDEADRMLDEYFAEQMKEIIKQCSRTRQTMLFSATMSTEVTALAAVSLINPVKVFVNSNTSVAQNLRQEFVKIRKTIENAREAVLAYLICRTFHEQCIVFVQTKVQCHRLHVLLGLLGVSVGELHGNLSQTHRLAALQNFKDLEIGVLLCTDLAARGLDIPKVKTVINFTLPATYQNYVHRVGRTARAGHCGRSISLVGDQEYRVLKQIKKESKTVVYERQPNKDVLTKYITKIEKLEPQIITILRVEKEEREIKSMENSVNAMKNKIDTKPEDFNKRNWFQSHKERLVEKKKLTIEESKKKKHKKGGKPTNKNENAAEVRLQREVMLAHRVAKKADKQKRLRGEHDDIQTINPNKENKKKGNKSAFDQELTRVDRKSVKKFRSGPSYMEKKEAFGKKNPNKKFKQKRK